MLIFFRKNFNLKTLLGLASVFVTRGAAAFGGIILSIIIARMTGADGLGQFTILLSFLAAFGIISRRGLDVILIRDVADAINSGNESSAPFLFRNAIYTARGSLLVMALLGAALYSSEIFGTAITGGAWMFALALPMLTLLALIAGYMKGAGKPWLAPMFEIGGVSLISTGLIAIVWLFGYPPDLALTMILFIAAIGLMCIYGFFWLSRDAYQRRAISSQKQQPNGVKGTLLQGQVAFTIIALSGFLIQAGSFLIAAPFLSDESLGLVRAAERLALIISFPILAIDPFIAARIVRNIHLGSVILLWHLMGKAILVGVVIGAPLLVCMLFFTENFLYILGPGFISATPHLRVLAIVHFVLLILGPFSTFINMAGGERQLMWVSGFTLVVAAVIYPLSTCAYGISGFVIAYAFVSVFRAVVITFLAGKGINSLKIT